MGCIIAWVTIKRDDYRGFFVCNRTLPLYIVTFALLGQGLDISSALGNAVNIYKFAFWDGAVIPIGVGLSLLLNGLLLAAPINRMGLLTLPDLFRRKYGALMEVMVSLVEVASFTVLLAGNLVGISLVLQFCFGLPKGAGVAIAGALLAVYTASGGLYSVALTDIPQVLAGLTGLLVVGVYLLVAEHPAGGPVAVAGPSRGFTVDLGGNVTAHTPGYSGPASCAPDPRTGQRTCDNYAYPRGDRLVYGTGMTDPDAYAPLPNAILYNWSNIFVLGFGNLCALDFQARCIAAKCPRSARIASFVSGGLLLLIAVPFGLALGSLARKVYGPDSPYAVFEVDTCSAPLGRPSCAEWVPQDHMALFATLWDKAPRALGAWAMVAIVTAAVSTADGAILATATVAAHNLWRKVPRIGSRESNLLLVSRLFVVPMTALACCVALLAYRTSYLLVVSFDIVFAGVLVPLLAAVHWPNVSPNAGILSCLAGSLMRITLEQLLPKDGSLVAPLGASALGFGRAVAGGLPAFMQVDPPDLTQAAGVWDPDKQVCKQAPLADWTGLDSLLSPVFALATMGAVSLAEWRWPGLDVLWFVPKAWRQASPLYLAAEDGSGHSQLDKLLLSSPSPSRHRHARPRFVMPSVPEEDHLYSEGSEGSAAVGITSGSVAVAYDAGPRRPARAADGSTRPSAFGPRGKLAATGDLEAAARGAGDDEEGSRVVVEEGVLELADCVLGLRRSLHHEGQLGGNEDRSRSRSRSRGGSRSLHTSMNIPGCRVSGSGRVSAGGVRARGGGGDGGRRSGSGSGSGIDGDDGGSSSDSSSRSDSSGGRLPLSEAGVDALAGSGSKLVGDSGILGVEGANALPHSGLTGHVGSLDGRERASGPAASVLGGRGKGSGEGMSRSGAGASDRNRPALRPRRTADTVFRATRPRGYVGLAAAGAGAGARARASASLLPGDPDGAADPGSLVDPAVAAVAVVTFAAAGGSRGGPRGLVARSSSV